MKEMVYKRRNIIPEVLHKGTYEGRKFCIISWGTHPTAYVSLTGQETLKSMDYDEYNLKVHGGATFLDRSYWENGTDYYIGWDYAHYGDFSMSWNGLGSDFDGKMWSTEEIFEDVKSAIEQLNSGEVLEGIR